MWSFLPQFTLESPADDIAGVRGGAKEGFLMGVKGSFSGNLSGNCATNSLHMEKCYKAQNLSALFKQKQIRISNFCLYCKEWISFVTYYCVLEAMQEIIYTLKDCQ